MKSGYIAGLDGLRSIAVLSVLFFHAGFDQWFSGGYVGVDIFFVISGFLITRLIMKEVESNGTFSFSNFYYRRCKRLFPALLFTLVASFIFAFLLFTPQHFERFGGELVYSALSISNFFFWSESGYFNNDAVFKPLLHTWSLSVEEQFYLFWPITLVLLAKHLSKSFVLVIIFIVSAVSFLANLIMQDGGHSSVLTSILPSIAGYFSDGQASIFYLAPFRIFEFGIGAMLVWLLNKPQTREWLLELSLAVGLLMLGYSIVSFDETTVFPSYNALIPCIGSALVIYGVNARYLGIIIRNKIAVGVGLISYSLYLCHWPIIVFYKYYKMLPLSKHEEYSIVVISLIVGTLMYLFIEQPFRKHTPSINGRSRAGFGLASALILLVLILPAATVWTNSGWTWRIPEIPEKIAQQLGDSTKFQIENYGGAGYPERIGWIGQSSADKLVDIVMIGDSHVRHYAYGLDGVFVKQYKKNIFIASAGCLVMPNSTKIKSESQKADKECSDAFDTAIKVTKANPKAVLIISHFWRAQMAMNKNTNAISNDISYYDITSKLSTIKKLIPNNPMIVIGQVPRPSVSDVIGCFSRPAYIKIDCEKVLSRPLSSLPTRGGNKILSNYADSQSGVFYFEPQDALCVSGDCYSVLNGKVLYSDSHHLSKEGSARFIEHFKGDILAIMQPD